MSTSTIVAVNAAVVAANAARTVPHAASPAPGIWMLLMLAAMVPWAIYIYSDQCMNSKKGFEISTWALCAFGVVSAGVLSYATSGGA